MKIGVLGLQGAVSEHLEMLTNCGVEAVKVRERADLIQLKGLIVPGGESTTIGRLIEKSGFKEPILQMAAMGVPIMGTCAGLVLLGREVKGYKQKLLSLMDTLVVRNGFGRQKDSFEAELKLSFTKSSPFTGVFIRAPYILEAGKGVEILGYYDEKIIAARQKNVLALSFHPELTGDDRAHKLFIDICKNPA